MGVNGINSATQAYDNKGAAKTKSTQNQQVDEKKQKDTETAAAVYDKSEQAVDTKKTYQKDSVTIDRMIAEADKRAQSLRDLVEKMLLKQGQTFTEATDIYALLREGKLEVDPETSAKAQKDIAEDGYWGVNQTSDRMLSFAKALSGSDPSKANLMIDAVRKGYEEAAKAWGGELPEISKKTLEATISKLEAWRDGTDTSSSMSNAAAQNFKNQAGTGKVAE
jgi:hypothetical protein